jgi:hypothetical protein
MYCVLDSGQINPFCIRWGGEQRDAICSAPSFTASEDIDTYVLHTCVSGNISRDGDDVIAAG